MVELLFWLLSLLIYLGFSVWLAKAILVAIFHAVSSREGIKQPAVVSVWADTEAVKASDGRLDHAPELPKR